MKLHEIMMGMIIVAAMVVGISMFLSGGVAKYPVSDFNASQFQAINDSMTEMIDIANDTQADLMDLKADSGVTDILGAFVTSAYGAVRTAGASFGVFTGAISAVIAPLPLGNYGGTVVAMTLAIVLIAFIAILLHVVTKSDRS